MQIINISISKFITITTLLLFGLLYHSELAASQMGKLSGTIITPDGNPVPGANITIEDLNRGGASDLEGRFFILAIPPGNYTIRTSALGFRNVDIEQVVIKPGITTILDFVLEEESIVLDPVTVVYKRPPVELNETNERIHVDGAAVRQMPVRQASEIVALQPGFVRDASGDLHLRGGRSGELGYYVDGIRIEDPLYGEESARIGRDAIQELSVQSGTFNAEYGEAMSGIVELITREGSDKYSARIEYESGMVNPSPYRQKDWVENNSDAVRDPVSNRSRYETTDVMDEDVIIPFPGRYSANLSGPVPGVTSMNFFMNAINEAEDLHTPFGYKWTRKTTGKISWSPKAGKLVFSYGLRAKDKKSYNHTWKYVPEHYHTHFVKSTRLSLSWTHNISPSLYYTTTAGWFDRRHDVKVFEDWQDYLDNGYQPEDFTFAQYFFDEDDWSDTWREGKTKTFSVGSKATWQMGNYHQWGAGVSFRSHDINLLDIRELQIGDNLEPAGVIDKYNENPVEADVYIQDKIELDYLVVNAGLRLDYVDPRTQGWIDIENPNEELEDVDASYQLSPRIGLAHPVSDKTTLHFAYGHFFQFPDYVNLFLNSTDLNPDTLAVRSLDAVGNRTLKPQKTVAYEVGLKGILSEDMGYSLTAFYKDITDLVGTRQVRVGVSYNYAAFINIDYASVIGFEAGITKNLSDYWSLQANYTYSVAKGNSSEPLEGYYNAYYQRPEAQQEYYMDFDRRHVANLLFTWQTGENRYPKLFGSTFLQGLMFGVITNISSGLPYTPYSGAGEQLSLRNSERMDYTARLDIRLSKTLMFRPVRLSVFTNIDNLFDRINPLEVESRTGEPWETTLPGNDISFDQLHDPGKVDIPRIVRVGIALEY